MYQKWPIISSPIARIPAFFQGINRQNRRIQHFRATDSTFQVMILVDVPPNQSEVGLKWVGGEVEDVRKVVSFFGVQKRCFFI